MKQALRQELMGVALFVGAIWITQAIDFLLPIDFNAWGLRPREVVGLIGIPLMPFLHDGWGHLISNTIPLLILLTLLAGSRANSVATVVALVVVGNSLLWIGGRSAIHVGASGLVYGLIAFMIAAGFFERRFVPIVIALIVLFLYGGTMLWGVLPSTNRYVSWEGHLFGAMAGFALAYLLAKQNRNEGKIDPFVPDEHVSPTI